jgi:hypothetical protein
LGEETGHRIGQGGQCFLPSSRAAQVVEQWLVGLARSQAKLFSDAVEFVLHILDGRAFRANYFALHLGDLRFQGGATF